jgi:hypothetical protein
MSNIKQKRTPTIYAIVVWMVINVVFMALELTVFNDAADLNNSILLILWLVSIVSLTFTKKYGAAVAVFVLVYAFSFNAFNIIYFGSSIAIINGISAIINFAAAIYLLTGMTSKQ